MAMETDSELCFTCHKDASTYTCRGCSHNFCLQHSNEHHQMLQGQLDQIVNEHDQFRHTLNEHQQNPSNVSPIKQIDQWEAISIEKIRKTAEEGRKIVVDQRKKVIDLVQEKFDQFTSQLKHVREKNGFNEIDLQPLTNELAAMNEKLNEASNNSIQDDPQTLIHKIQIPLSNLTVKKGPSGSESSQQDEDADGETLWLMTDVERVKSIVSKYNQQHIFIRELLKFFAAAPSNKENNENKTIEERTTHASESSFPPDHTSMASSTINSTQTSSFCFEETSVDEPELLESPILIKPDVTNDFSARPSLPADYSLPSFPQSLSEDIDNGAIEKFEGYSKNRKILMDAIFYDLTINYNIWYPSQNEYDTIVDAILNFLKIEKSEVNKFTWREVLKYKYQERRRMNTSANIQMYREKFPTSKSAKIMKKKVSEVAQRDRLKQICPSHPLTNNSSDDAWEKLAQLRNEPPTDQETLLDLWRSTLYARRFRIHKKSTLEIITQYPGYSNPTLIFEEVKLRTGIEIDAAVRRQVPVLLEKFPVAAAFINDSMPIRLLKVLCRYFGESCHHIFNSVEPTTPYPSMTIIDDVFHINVDYNHITQTSSPDDALALVLSMFWVFELAFDKKERVLRFLYIILFGDERYLAKATRNLLREKLIDIYAEKKLITPSKSFPNVPTPRPETNEPSSSVCDVLANKVDETNGSSILHGSDIRADASSTEHSSVATSAPIQKPVGRPKRSFYSSQTQASPAIASEDDDVDSSRDSNIDKTWQPSSRRTARQKKKTKLI